MSQTTNDLFDAFRNIYLALEALLSHIAPMRLTSLGKPAEREGEWTRRALHGADAALRTHNPAQSLGRYLAVPASSDEVNDVFLELYVDVRTAIFHAKAGRGVALPQDWNDRLKINDALERYARLYTDLAEAVLGARFLRSGLGVGGFNALTGLLEDWQVGVTAEQYSVLALFDHDAAARLAVLSTAREPSLDEPFRAAVVGKAEAGTLGELPSPIRTVAARTSDGVPVTMESLEFELDLADVTRLAIVMTYAAHSSGARVHYET